MTSASAPQACSEPAPPPFLRRVWERMAAIYPNRWRSAMGESPQADGGKLTVYGDTWAKGLAGLSPEQLGRGLEACITRADPWPPALAEFRALCIGIPSLLQVREDIARKNSQRAPFTLLVLRHIDSWAFRHADQREAERLLRDAYADARDAVMRGEPLPEPAPEIEHQPQQKRESDLAACAEHIRAIRNILGD